MRIELFLYLLLAHLVADFILQNNQNCKDKEERKWCSLYHYGHAAIVFGLSWIASWNWSFGWCALIIGVSHFGIDMWKSYKEEHVKWFSLDQLLHIGVLAGIAWMVMFIFWKTQLSKRRHLID